MVYFDNSTEVGTYRGPTAPTNRRFLVFVRCGRQPVRQPFWPKAPAKRQFDVMANFYAPPGDDCWLLDYADFVTYGGLSKFHAAKRLLEGGLLRRYAGFHFLDDDVETHFDPGAFGNFVIDNAIDLAQPALTHDSHSSWRITLRHPSCAWRETSFVEVMAPFFTHSTLTRAIAEFDTSISTWGLDIRWGYRFSEAKLAVVDMFTMAHRKPIDPVGGPFYQYLRKIGIDPEAELARAFRELGIQRYEMVTRRVVFLPEALARASNSDSGVAGR